MQERSTQRVTLSRHLLEKHRLTETLFEEINAYLHDQGLLLKQGTLVDATVIDAPGSTDNDTQYQD